METSYRIEEDESGLSVELNGAGGKKEELLQTFSECKEGRCSCPTDEYEKLASMGVEESGEVIRLRLAAKAGEKFDTSEIAACLDYTTQRLGQ